MENIIPFMLAILTGVLTTLEASISAELGKFVTPKIAIFHNMIMGLTVMSEILLINGTLGQYKKIVNVPLKWSTGGIFGTFAIYLLAVIIPKLGVTITFTIVITFQILSGFFIDTFMLNQQFELIQIIGLVMIITGLYIVMK